MDISRKSQREYSRSQREHKDSQSLRIWQTRVSHHHLACRWQCIRCSRRMKWDDRWDSRDQSRWMLNSRLIIHMLTRTFTLRPTTRRRPLLPRSQWFMALCQRLAIQVMQPSSQCSIIRSQLRRGNHFLHVWCMRKIKRNNSIHNNRSINRRNIKNTSRQASQDQRRAFRALTCSLQPNRGRRSSSTQLTSRRSTKDSPTNRVLSQ